MVGVPEHRVPGRNQTDKAEVLLRWTTEDSSQCHLLSDCESQAVADLASRI